MPNTKKRKDGVEQLIAKAFAHPLRVQILTILNERVASPNLIAKELDQSLNLVAYHVRVLEKYDCVEMIETKQRRGATEHFYRATRRQFLNDSEWERMPESLRPALSGAMLKAIFSDVKEAVDRGTLDELEDRHLSRTAIQIDRQGWEEIATLLGESLERVLAIRAKASARLAKSGEAGLSCKVELMHFLSPPPEPEADGESDSE